MPPSPTVSWSWGRGSKKGLSIYEALPVRFLRALTRVLRVVDAVLTRPVYRRETEARDENPSHRACSQHGHKLCPTPT